MNQGALIALFDEKNPRGLKSRDTVSLTDRHLQCSVNSADGYLVQKSSER
jgi:hypothetical protein